MAPYVASGKPNLDIEYIEEGATLARWCDTTEAYGLSLVVTTLDLSGEGARPPGA